MSGLSLVNDIQLPKGYKYLSKIELWPNHNQEVCLIGVKPDIKDLRCHHFKISLAVNWVHSWPLP